MAGHSKWANIKHKKAAVDAKRGKVFTKIARVITVAAKKAGPDPEMNPSLRLAIDKAKAVNMPKDNIERAIKKGAGGEGEDSFEEMTYEGYGAGGVAIYVEALTDNRNRTTPEVRKIFEKAGGNMGEQGCVGWMFHRKGVIELEASAEQEDQIMEDAIESGAEDFSFEEGHAEVTTGPDDLNQVLDGLRAKGYEPKNAELLFVPETKMSAEKEVAEKVLKLMDILDDHDDVQNVYTNMDFPEDLETE